MTKLRTKKQESLVKWLLTDDRRMTNRQVAAALKYATLDEQIYWSMSHSDKHYELSYPMADKLEILK